MKYIWKWQISTAWININYHGMYCYSIILHYIIWSIQNEIWNTVNVVNVGFVNGNLHKIAKKIIILETEPVIFEITNNLYEHLFLLTKSKGFLVKN